MSSYTLYVPALGAMHDIRAGSAIVGETRGNLIETDYEGGGASNVRTFEEKLHHAASRRAQRYPTSARRAWVADELTEVGSIRYDEALRHWVIADIRDPDALNHWAPEEHVIGGSEALILAASGRRWHDLPGSERIRLAAMNLPLRALADEIIASTNARADR